MAGLRTRTGRLESVTIAAAVLASVAGGVAGRFSATPPAPVSAVQQVPAVHPAPQSMESRHAAVPPEQNAPSPRRAPAAATTRPLERSGAEPVERLTSDDVLRRLRVTQLSPTDELMLARLEERGRLGLLLVPE